MKNQLRILTQSRFWEGTGTRVRTQIRGALSSHRPGPPTSDLHPHPGAQPPCTGSGSAPHPGLPTTAKGRRILNLTPALPLPLQGQSTPPQYMEIPQTGRSGGCPRPGKTGHWGVTADQHETSFRGNENGIKLTCCTTLDIPYTTELCPLCGQITTAWESDLNYFLKKRKTI